MSKIPLASQTISVSPKEIAKKVEESQIRTRQTVKSEIGVYNKKVFIYIDNAANHVHYPIRSFLIIRPCTVTSHFLLPTTAKIRKCCETKRKTNSIQTADDDSALTRQDWELL